MIITAVGITWLSETRTTKICHQSASQPIAVRKRQLRMQIPHFVRITAPKAGCKAGSNRRRAASLFRNCNVTARMAGQSTWRNIPIVGGKKPLPRQSNSCLTLPAPWACCKLLNRWLQREERMNRLYAIPRRQAFLQDGLWNDKWTVTSPFRKRSFSELPAEGI